MPKPKTMTKARPARKARGKSETAVPAGVSAGFGALLANPALMFQAYDLLPIPIEVFAADGTTAFLNRAFLEMNNVTDESLGVGVYNVLNDPMMERMGLKDGIRRAFFHGESYAWYDIEIPIQDMQNRGLTAEKPFEKSSADWFLCPVMDGGKVAYVIFFMQVKNLYHGRKDLARAKAYMDSHWRDKYDREAVAQAAGMSVSQLYDHFKTQAGMTPGEYHKSCKVERIKEKLGDLSLSIKEAFAACGEDSQGSIARVFKEVTGRTPTQFRKRN